MIFWGSQSGVTERFAKRLSREWHSRFALKTMLAEMDEYDPEHLAALPKGKFAVFMTSTYGEGDPPDNVVDFWNGLAKMKKNGVKLDGLRYLAMGLGNKNYKHYNQTIKVGSSNSICLLSHLHEYSQWMKPCLPLVLAGSVPLAWRMKVREQQRRALWIGRKPFLKALEELLL